MKLRVACLVMGVMAAGAPGASPQRAYSAGGLYAVVTSDESWKEPGWRKGAEGLRHRCDADLIVCEESVLGVGATPEQPQRTRRRILQHVAGRRGPLMPDHSRGTSNHIGAMLARYRRRIRMAETATLLREGLAFFLTGLLGITRL